MIFLRHIARIFLLAAANELREVRCASSLSGLYQRNSIWWKTPNAETHVQDLDKSCVCVWLCVDIENIKSHSVCCTLSIKSIKILSVNHWRGLIEKHAISAMRSRPVGNKCVCVCIIFQQCSYYVSFILYILAHRRVNSIIANNELYQHFHYFFFIKTVFFLLLEIELF